VGEKSGGATSVGGEVGGEASTAVSRIDWVSIPTRLSRPADPSSPDALAIRAAPSGRLGALARTPRVSPPMAIDRIFLDLDGVLADWSTAAIRACGQVPHEVFAAWPPGTAELSDVLDISPEEMWSHVHREGEAFWANLEPYPWTHEVFRLCSDLAPTTILTSPSLEPCSLSGKAVWMRRHFGPKFRDFLIGPDKRACARARAVLIDDSEKNCEAFERAGGRAIAFPALWNPVGDMRDPLPYLCRELARADTAIAGRSAVGLC
jgi:5'(3')-deoxyribonucleotidase